MKKFVLGFCLGAAIGVATLASGSFDVFFHDRWQEIVFFPGIRAGWAFHDCCDRWFPESWSGFPALIVGVVAFSVCFAALWWVVASIFARLLRRRRTAHAV